MMLMKKLRRDKGMTMQDVADRAFCSQSMISRIESGQRVPGVDILNGIARALGWTGDPELLLSQVGDDWQWPGAVK